MSTLSNSEFYSLESQSASTPPASTEQDRYNSLFNILRDYEEFTLNTEGKIMSSNLEAVSISGYEEWEVIGQSFELFYTAEDKENNKPQEDLKRATENGRVHVAGWRLKKKGKKFWAKIKIQALYNNENESLTGFKMTMRDATHNVMSNYRVKNIRSEYLNLFNNSFIGIFKFRFDDSRVLILNEKAVEILGCDSPHTIYFNQLFKDKGRYQALISALVESGKAEDFEFELATEHEVKWVSISCKHFTEGNFIEGIVLDISESKMQVMELQRLNHELDQFLYHSSHDLRSPLTSILGLVNLIKMEEPPKVIGEYADMIGQRINHLDTLLKDIVAITYHHKSDIEIGLFDFESEVKNIVADLSKNFPMVNVVVRLDENTSFYTDASRVRTILRHLISNALKFYNPSLATPFVRINLLMSTSSVRILVQDNGIGIPADHQKGIFELFFKGTSSSGAGLGLYIVKQLVEALQGEIELESAEGQGTTFMISLPNRAAKGNRQQ